MDLVDYGWNAHERQLKADGLEKTPSPYKVKILDVLNLRTQLEEALSSLSKIDLSGTLISIIQTEKLKLLPQLKAFY